MAKLCQIIAIEKGIKSKATAELTSLYKLAQKSELFNGVDRVYRKIQEDGEDLPAEKKKVQAESGHMLQMVKGVLAELFNVTARKDWTNSVAKADVKVDGETLISGVPVTYLLFLEKNLIDVRTFVNHLPVLDDAEDWTKDENSGLFKSEKVSTHRTKKVNKPLVLYPATDKHPAQTQLVTEDILVGYWDTIKQSGALAAPRKEELMKRVEKLLNAVKSAREEANTAEENKGTPTTSEIVFGYLFS